MRFDRVERHAYRDMLKKRWVVERELRREREAFPMYAHEIEATQPSVDEILVLRAIHAARAEAEFRAVHARQWREVRRRYFALSANTRAAFARAWCTWAGPAAPSHMGFLLTKFERRERAPGSTMEGKATCNDIAA